MGTTVIEITVYIFDTVGSLFLRTEVRGISLPIQVVSSRSSINYPLVNSKILYGENFQEEVYVAETAEQIADLINGGGDSDWIMDGGHWDDDGIWIDDETWTD